MLTLRKRTGDITIDVLIMKEINCAGKFNLLMAPKPSPPCDPRSFVSYSERFF